VIALLIALLVPALQRARRQARTVVCQSNLRQWAMTLATYTEAHDGCFPSDRSGTSGFLMLLGMPVDASDPDADRAAFHGFDTKGIALCPMATRPGLPPDNIGSGFRIKAPSGLEITGEPGWCNSAWQVLTPSPAFLGSYGYNHSLFWGFRVDDYGLLADRIPSVNVFSLRGQGSIPVMLDATLPMSSRSTLDPRYHAPGVNPDRGGVVGRGMNMFLMDRHGREINGMFLDFSVRKVGLKELYTLKWASDFDRAGPWTKAGGVLPEDWPKWMRNCKDY
jgi:hypothetical protein